MEDNPTQEIQAEEQASASAVSLDKVVAKPARGYLIRIALIAVLVTGFSAYFLYDGYIAYPRNTEIFNAYEQYKENYPQNFSAAWRQDIADPNSDVYGMPSDQSGHPGKLHSEKDIFTQKLLGFGLAPIGLFMIYYFLVFLNRSVRVDGNQIKAYGGVNITFDDITTIDRTRWAKKGIAIVHYKKDGKAGKLTLDDWKFDRNPTKLIMAAIEANVDESKFVDPDDLTATAVKDESSSALYEKGDDEPQEETK